MYRRKRYYKKRRYYRYKRRKYYRKRKSVKKSWGFWPRKRGMRKGGSKLRKVSKAVKNLQLKSSESTTRFHSREYFSDRIVTVVNKCDWNNYTLNAVANLNAVMTAVPWFDVNDQTTPVYIDLSTPAGGANMNKQIFVKYARIKVEFRNNDQAPCFLQCYYFSLKADSSLTPLDCMQDSYNHNAANFTDIDIDSLSTHPSDCQLLNKIYTVKKGKTYFLQPGQQCSVFMKSPSFKWDPTTAMNHNLEFLKCFRFCGILTKTWGAIVHGTTPANIGYSPAILDVIGSRRFILEYDGGISQSVYEEVTSFNDPTNPVVVNRPEAVDQLV